VSWRRWWSYRYLLAEEFVLAREREALRAQREAEDAQFNRSAEALRRVK